MTTVNLEAEQSVLGALLIDVNVWDRIQESIEEKDFCNPEHQLIFRHIKRMADTAGSIDVLTIAESIESTGKLALIGGLPYLGSLATSVNSTKNVILYADIVRKNRKERDFQSVIAELQESSGNFSEKVKNAIDILTSLADDKKDTVVSLREASQKALTTLDNRFTNGGDIHGLKTLLNGFDAKTGGLQKGDLIIIAGRPSMGKTAFATNIAENVAVTQNLPVLMFSLEMSDEQLATRAMASVGKISLNTMRSAKIQDDDWEKLTNVTNKFFDAPFFIDPNPMMTASQMHLRAKKIKRQHGLSLVVIDYLQLMTEGGDTRNNELSTITRKLKMMAKDLDCPVICLSQLSRKVEERADKRPMMSDLRDSGAIEQDADLIVMMYRDEYYNKDSPNKGTAEAIISKQRMGETGAVRLTFQGEYSRFKDFVGDWRDQPKKQTGRGMGDY
ncbi:MAG: replicative DNA helicase [Elusimicrobia bacterium]|nr:replicative DNA helicase [Elusimicrobiota bacterium]